VSVSAAELLNVDAKRIIGEVVAELPDERVVHEARAIFEQVALGDEFPEFLTLPAYDRLLELT
jgi:malate synthase